MVPSSSTCGDVVDYLPSSSLCTSLRYGKTLFPVAIAGNFSKMHLPLKYAFALALTVIPGLKTIAKAQDLGGLPSCAKPAILAAFQASGCKATDADCLCSNPNLVTSLATYVQKACSPADQAAVVAFGETYCGSSSSEAGSSTAASTTTATTQPSDIPLPGFTITTAPGPLTTDSSYPPHAGVSTSLSYSRTMTYSTTATSKPTNGTQTGGAATALETGLSAAALAIAVGAMGWVFAEL